MELSEAWEWYEDKQTGLGDRFKQKLYKRVQQITLNPQRYPVRKEPYRETKIDVSPYLVICRIDEIEKLIIILSIFHAKRNPRKKYQK